MKTLDERRESDLDDHKAIRDMGMKTHENFGLGSQITVIDEKKIAHKDQPVVKSPE